MCLRFRPWLPTVVILFLASAQMSVAQDGPGENGSQSASLDQQITSAYETRNVGSLRKLVETNRLEIKPIVNQFIDRAIRFRLDGESERAQHQTQVASAVAATFRDSFGETSLSSAVGYLDRWSVSDLSDKLLADSLYAAGTTLRGSGDTRSQAQSDYERALELYRGIGDKIGEASTVGGLGYISWFGDRDSYLEWNEHALALRREVDDRELIGNSLNDVALAYRSIANDQETALRYYLESERVRIDIGDSLALARLLPNIGRTCELLGELDMALAYYERAAEVAEAVGDHGRQSVALRNAGAVSSDLGRLSEALLLFQKALDVREAADDETVDILNHLGVTYRRLGDYESALQYYQQVVDIATETDDSETLADALSNIGVVYVYADRPDRSLRYFERARAQSQEIEDFVGVLNATINLGAGQFELGEYEAAGAHADEALALARELGDEIGETTALTLKGNVLTRTNEFDAAVSNYQEALQNAVSLGMPDLIFSATLGLGEVNERRGDYDRAISFYEDGFAVLETTRGNLSSDDDKAAFLAQQRYTYEQYIHMLSLLGQSQPDAGFVERSFLFAERAKARSFLDQLAEALANVQSGIDPALIQRQDSLLRDVALLRNQVTMETASSEQDAAKLGEFKERLGTSEAEYAALRRQLRNENPKFAELQYPQPLSLSEVQNEVLDDDVALLEYSLGDSSSTLWIVTRDADRLVVLPPRSVIREQIELIRYALTDRSASNADQFARSARRLYEILVEPAADFLATKPNLVVVPDDALHYLPFEVLLTGQVDDGAGFDALPYLVLDHAVSYAQSASILAQVTSNREERAAQPSKGLLAFGDPVFASEVETPTAMRSAAPMLARLPYSGAEVESIAAYFAPGDADVFLRSQATEEKLKSAESMGSYKYLHLATHGLVDERRPDFSAVVLAYDNDPNEDGLLQAAEIFNLKLNTDMVVLSACETGLGQMVRGEGLVGLTRAFMYAGAPSVIVSLWAVADASTSKLMDRLYRSLATRSATTADRHGEADASGKTRALRQAKVEMITSGEYAHPFYWAPFVLTGDWQ